jgi:hypothetical protein
VKISIEIDGVPVAEDASEIPSPPSKGQSSSDASPDVLARAQAVGARDGGGAPAELPHAGAPPIPSVIPGSSAPAAAATDQIRAVSAGAAPGGEGTHSIAVEQDPEAPATPDEGGTSDG